MICLQILGGHGACGHEAAEGSCVGIGRAGHGGESREICEEGGDCGEGAESDVGVAGQGVRARMGRMRDGDGSRRVIATDLLNQVKRRKRKRSHSGDTDFVSY
jgi:hypothetical protein